MPRPLCLLLAAFTVAAHGQRLDVAYGFPFYSPLEQPDDSESEWRESRGYLAAGLQMEPAPFLATGPRLGWSFWDFSHPRADDAYLEIRKWEFGWSVTPNMEVARATRLFLDVSIGLQYLRYAWRGPDIASGGVQTWRDLLSRTEWGYGRSLGVGMEVYWLRFSLHHDAFLAESLAGEFAGMRGAIGIVYRRGR